MFVGTGASIRDRAKKAPSRIARALKIDFRGHDLRRTAATKMAEAGVPRHHISAVLNHVEAGAAVTRIYDRYSYDAEKRRALETWVRSCAQSLSSRNRGGCSRSGPGHGSGRVTHTIRSPTFAVRFNQAFDWTMTYR